MKNDWLYRILGKSNLNFISSDVNTDWGRLRSNYLIYLNLYLHRFTAWVLSSLISINLNLYLHFTELLNIPNIGQVYVRITLSFLAVKMDKIKKFIILCWITFYITIFPKELAEKSYLTFNLRVLMIWAAATPIKTNCSRILLCVALIHWQKAEPAKCLN